MPCTHTHTHTYTHIHIHTQFAKEEAEWLFDGKSDPKAISDALPQKPAVIVTDGGSELRWAIGGVQGKRAAFRVEVGL